MQKTSDLRRAFHLSFSVELLVSFLKLGQLVANNVSTSSRQPQGEGGGEKTSIYVLKSLR